MFFLLYRHPSLSWSIIEFQIGDGEELVRSLDEKLKEKDVELQELVTKYKELLKKQRVGDFQWLVQAGAL